MKTYGQIYDFTNENLTVLPELYDFEGKNVLSVLGSGDQYFASLLYGARVVDVFDINEVSWYYFVLKFMAIRHLSYEEFYNFFITNGLEDDKTYIKLRDYLPTEIRTFFDSLLKSGFSLSIIKLNNKFFIPPRINNGSIIPYFSKENYELLKKLLLKSELPKFLCGDILKLPSEVKYDLILLSNVFNYIPLGIKEYRQELNKFSSPVIQALYSWDMPEEGRKKFMEHGFTIDYVPTSTSSKKDYNPQGKDCILTLRK